MDPNSVTAANKFINPNPETAPRTVSTNKYGSNAGYISTKIFRSQYTVHGAINRTRPTSTKYRVKRYRERIRPLIEPVS